MKQKRGQNQGYRETQENEWMRREQLTHPKGSDC
jgi:hypothetical protein